MRKALRTKRALIGLTALAVLVGGGAAIGATQLAPSSDSQAIIDDAAKRLGVEPQKLSDALEQAYGDRIDKAVEAGRLTEEQATELKARIAAGDMPLVGVPGRHGHDGFGGGRHGGPFGGFEAVTDYLGLDRDALRAQLEAGKSLADVAAAQGKTAEGLKAAITAAATEKLDAAVADGRLTAGQKQRMLDELGSRIDDMITRTGAPGAFGHHRHHDRDGDGPDGDPAAPGSGSTTQPASITY